MAIDISGDPGDFTVTVDKEGFRRIIRFGIAGGDRDYSKTARAGARAASWATRVPAWFARKKAKKAVAASEQYDADVASGSAGLLAAEPAVSGWMDAIYSKNWPLVLRQSDRKSQQVMQRPWRVFEDCGGERADVRARLTDVLSKYSDTNYVVENTLSEDDSAPLLIQNPDASTAAAAAESNIFTKETRERLANLNRTDCEAIASMICG